MAKALGIDDSVTSCDCCGKSGLKSTVIIELDDGEIVHYGCVCAARNTGKAPKQISAEIKTEAKRVRDAAAAELRASAEHLAYRAKLAERNRLPIKPGREAMEFVRAESDAESAARARIASKFGLKAYEVMA